MSRARTGNTYSGFLEAEERAQKKGVKNASQLFASMDDEDSQDTLRNFHSLRCPITQGVLQDPVLAQDGQVYSRHAIEAYFHSCGENAFSPVTGVAMVQTLTPLPWLRRILEELREKYVPDSVAPGPSASAASERPFREKSSKELAVFQREWQEKVQEATRKGEALEKELLVQQAEKRRAEADLGQMRAQQKKLNTEREQLRRAERQLKAQLDKQDKDTSVVKLDATRHKDELAGVREQLVEAEARCLKLQDDMAHATRLLEAEQRITADLKLRNEELKTMLEKHCTPAERRDTAAGPDSPKGFFKKPAPGMVSEHAAANGEFVRLGTSDGEERQQAPRFALELEPVPVQLSMRGVEFQAPGASPSRSGQTEAQCWSCECGCVKVSFYKPGPVDERSLPLRSAGA